MPESQPIISITKDNTFEKTKIHLHKIQTANPNKTIIDASQGQNIITFREFDIVEICNSTPNDMELGKKLREYINQHFI